MKKIAIIVALVAAATSLCEPAFADIVVKNGVGANVSTCSTTVGVTEVPCHQVKNAAGTTINPATSEKQAAPGTAGTPSVDVITVQGISGGTAQAADTIVRSAATDRGTVVATAGTAQQLMAANSTRRGFSVQNQSSGACYINGSAAATQDYHSLLIAAGSYFETKDSHVGTGAISIVCAVANASEYAREW
jgi:hypothetical protein